MAKLLCQPALLSFLQQGEREPFIVEVLRAPDAEKLADLLARSIPADPAHAKLLDKYLKRIVVRVVRLQDSIPRRPRLKRTKSTRWWVSSASSSKVPWMTMASLSPRSWKSSNMVREKGG